jgi:hypothetical protein
MCDQQEHCGGSRLGSRPNASRPTLDPSQCGLRQESILPPPSESHGTRNALNTRKN